MSYALKANAIATVHHRAAVLRFHHVTTINHHYDLGYSGAVSITSYVTTCWRDSKEHVG